MSIRKTMKMMKQIQRFTLGVDDTLVLQVKRKLTPEIVDMMQRSLASKFEGRKVLVIDGDVNLKVIRAA